MRNTHFMLTTRSADLLDNRLAFTASGFEFQTAQSMTTFQSVQKRAVSFTIQASAFLLLS